MSGRIIHEKKTALLALWPSQNQAQHYFLHEANRLTTIKVECIYTKYILTSSQSNPTTFDRNCAFRWILPHRHPVTSGTLLEQLFSVNWPLTTNGLWTSVNSRIRIHTHNNTLPKPRLSQSQPLDSAWSAHRAIRSTSIFVPSDSAFLRNYTNIIWR